MRLWTVQHRLVLQSLQDHGELAGDWARVLSPSYRSAYEEMVAEMARRGIDCAGRPPLWAWLGPDTRDDRVALTAELLLNPESEEDYGRYVVLDLDAPEEFVVLSSYGRWNDFLEAVLLGDGPPRMDWSIDQDELGEQTHGRVQACLPRVAGAWVVSTRPLRPSSLDEPEEAGSGLTR